MKLISLNIEGSKHLDRVIPFLREEKADVVCLQEVFGIDFEMMRKELGMQGKFVPTTDKDKVNEFASQSHGLQGECCLTRLEDYSIEHYYYVGGGIIKKFTNPYLKNRVLIYGTFRVGEARYVIGTTHYPWTPDGKSNEQQWQALVPLISFIKKFDDFILCGDFNAPRGGDIFTAFTEYFKDGLPQTITSTLDPVLHRKGNVLNLVVDTIFYTSGYEVDNVRVVEGLSDHKAVVGEIGVV